MTPVRSANHRATIALLRAALGAPQRSTDAGDVRAADPFAIMSIATSHRIVETLGPGVAEGRPLRSALEPDAVLFLEELHAANRRRNAALLRTIRSIGTLLADQERSAVVLKGGALLALGADANGRSDGRYVGDIDLLVPAELAHETQHALIAAGWTETPMAEIAHHHLPPLVHPELIGAIELHERLGSPAVEAALPAAEVIERSVPSGHPGIRVPAVADRVAHLALHAQLSEHGWRERRLRLCDAADLHRMDAVGMAGGGEVEPSVRRAIEAFHLAAALVLESPWEPAAGDRAARRWAHAAVRRLGRPNAARRARIVRATTDRLARLATSSDYRRHLIVSLGRPGEDGGEDGSAVGRLARRLRELR